LGETAGLDVIEHATPPRWIGNKKGERMTPQDVRDLRRLMEYEGARNGPPLGFPKFPDLPAGRYTDPRFFELEKQHVWRKSWLLAGHIDEIPEAGCYKLWETSGQPVVIIHSRSGAINAFYNTCSHRGAPVVQDTKGKRARFSCKYHGWTYDDEGKLVSIRDPRDFVDLDFSCRSLRAVRCERFGNLIFVNFDAGAPTLKDWIGSIAGEWEEFRFDRLRLVDHYVLDLESNWKIAMEANMEVYHVKSIHPATVDLLLDSDKNVNTLYPFGHGRMVAPSREAVGAAKPYLSGTPEIDIPTVGEIARTCTQSYGMFPNWVSPLGSYGFPVLLFWPNGLNKCKLEVWWFGADWGVGQKSANWEGYISAFNGVLKEDTEFGKWIQKSVESYGFKGVPLSYQEMRIYYWHQSADKLIGPQNVPPELRVEPVIGEEWIHPNEPRLDLVRMAAE
jgi:phenylpropionate dioxygenase-like ring-hydroxylating dioxygenase large terminal subunit